MQLPRGWLDLVVSKLRIGTRRCVALNARVSFVTDSWCLQLKKGREAARAKAIRDGLIPDPKRRTRLEEAFNLVGTCEDMCPEFEREQREYQRAVDKWELVRCSRVMIHRYMHEMQSFVGSGNEKDRSEACRQNVPPPRSR